MVTQSLVVGEPAEPHQQNLAHGLEGHDGPQLGHTHRQVLGDPVPGQTH